MTPDADNEKELPVNPTRLMWDLMIELRKEVVATQTIRAQIIGVKVTFVSGAIGLIVANIGAAGHSIHPSVLAAPAFAAIFLDFLIVSYSFSIKRIGYYIREIIERKVLRTAYNFPDGILLWQEHLKERPTRQRLSLIGNVGLTTLATVLGCVGIWFGEPLLNLYVRVGLISILAAFFLLSAYAHLIPGKLSTLTSY